MDYSLANECHALFTTLKLQVTLVVTCMFPKKRNENSDMSR